jgi:uncharacterized protein
MSIHLLRNQKTTNVVTKVVHLVMQFEWDHDKAIANLNKHRVQFEDAARVFLDYSRIETFDGRQAYGEDRWKTIGLVEPALLAVVYTVRSDTVRLISARKADANERAQYREK